MQRFLGDMQEHRAGAAAADLPLKHLLAIISMISLGTLSLALVSRHVQETVRTAYDALNSASARGGAGGKILADRRGCAGASLCSRRSW